MDDLIKRLKRKHALYNAMNGKAADSLTDEGEAATALTFAQATIARQQVMLDRALESNGDMMVRIGKLEEALRRYLPDAAHLYDCLIGPHHEQCTCGLDDIRAALAQGKGA